MPYPPHPPPPPPTSATTTAHMYVSKTLAGAIIGKGGVRIKEIRQRSGCSVKIEPAKPIEGEEVGDEERQVVSVVGPCVESTELAMYMLKQRVDSEAEKAARSRV